MAVKYTIYMFLTIMLLVLGTIFVSYIIYLLIDLPYFIIHKFYGT